MEIEVNERRGTSRDTGVNVIEVKCMSCKHGKVELRRRIVWPWQRLRGLKVRWRGVCPVCHIEHSINGWK